MASRPGRGTPGYGLKTTRPGKLLEQINDAVAGGAPMSLESAAQAISAHLVSARGLLAGNGAAAVRLVTMPPCALSSSPPLGTSTTARRR